MALHMAWSQAGRITGVLLLEMLLASIDLDYTWGYFRKTNLQFTLHCVGSC